MRRRRRARLLTRLALGLASPLRMRDSAAAVLSSRRRTPRAGPASATAGAGGGAHPTQAPVGAGGALRPALLAARAALLARSANTPAVA
jgi:hypothetical protein